VVKTRKGKGRQGRLLRLFKTQRKAVATGPGASGKKKEKARKGNKTDQTTPKKGDKTILKKKTMTKGEERAKTLAR